MHNWRSEPLREMIIMTGPSVNLQAGTVDDLIINYQLAATIIDDESTNASATVTEGITDTVKQVTLVNNGEALLDITGLSHGDDSAILTNIQNAVGLVDGTEHALDNNAGRRMRDEARLLVQLAGEKVYTEVAVLASLGRDGDADDLAWPTLQDQEITNTDEMAWDSDCLRGVSTTGLNDSDRLSDAITDPGRAAVISDDDLLLPVMVVVRVEDTVGSTLNATAERVVMTFVVVITHFAR